MGARRFGWPGADVRAGRRGAPRSREAQRAQLGPVALAYGAGPLVPRRVRSLGARAAGRRRTIAAEVVVVAGNLGFHGLDAPAPARDRRPRDALRFSNVRPGLRCGERWRRARKW